jgi:hypothetical protein
MPNANDLITLRKSPPNRVDKTEGGLEKHLTEPAVMLAYITYLMEQHPGLDGIEIHPDGEHGKQFDGEPGGQSYIIHFTQGQPWGQT